MQLNIQSSTEINADGSGSVTYAGDWDECREALAAFKLLRGSTGYTFAAFAPPAVLNEAPTPVTVEDTAAAWSAAEIAAKSLCVVTSASLRANPAGIGNLILKLASPDDLEKKIKDALDISPAERTFSFGVAEIPHSILEYEENAVADIINAWLAAPAVLRARFYYINAATGLNAALTPAEIVIARKFLLGQDTIYSTAPTVTMTISNATAAPTDLPDNGATTPPPNGVFPGWTGAWRVTSSGYIKNDDGTYNAAVIWQGAENNAPTQT